MKDWENAGMEDIVCACSNVNKGDVIEAISDGAETVEQVMKNTKMECSTPECKENVQALLDTFLAVVKGLESG